MEEQMKSVTKSFFCLFPVEFSEQLLTPRDKIWRGKEVVLTIYIPSRPLNNIVEEYGPALPSH